MQIREFGRACARFSLVAALSGSIVLAAVPAVPAYADLESELAEAKAELERLGQEYQSLQDALQNASNDLEVTKGEIEETQIELEQAQAILAENVANDYKNGGDQILEVILGSNDFDDLISRVFYMDKVSEAQAEAIEDVRTLQDQLIEQQTDEQQMIDDLQGQVDAAANNQSTAQALVNSLSAEVRAQLEAEAAQNASLAAGIQSAEDAEDENSLRDQIVENGNAQHEEEEEEEAPSAPSTPQQPAGGNQNQGSSGTSNVGGSALAYALGQEGKPYVYGGSSPSAGFDCSGLVYWAYLQIGVTDLPRTAGAQATYIKNHGRWTTNVSELQYGDLVFYSGHVAFYVGNGQVFGAWRQGRPAGYGGVYECGTPYGGGNI